MPDANGDNEMNLFSNLYRPIWASILIFVCSSAVTVAVVAGAVEQSVLEEKNERLLQAGGDLRQLLKRLQGATTACKDFLANELKADLSLEHAITQAGAFCQQGLPLDGGWVVIGQKEPDGSHLQLYNSRVGKIMSGTRVPADLEFIKEINHLFDQSLQTGASLLSPAFEGPVTGGVVLTTIAALKERSGTYVSLAFDPVEIAASYNSRSSRYFAAFALQDPSRRWVFSGDWSAESEEELEKYRLSEGVQGDYYLHDLAGRADDALVSLLHLDNGWVLAGAVARPTLFDLVGSNWRETLGLITLQALALTSFCFWFVMKLRERTIEKLDLEGQVIRHSDAQKASLIKAMAHEIRSPIIRLIGALELAGDSARDTQEILASSLLSATTVLQLCDDLLDLGQMGAGEYQSVISAFDIEGMLKEIESEYTQFAHEQKSRLNFQFEGGNAIVHSDRLRVRQIITNLVHNALRATPGGVVSVVVSVQTKHSKQGGNAFLKVVVSDNGIGMSEDVKARIFDEFVTYSENGTGLGLSVVKRILQRLNGSVEVESAVGSGSVFTVTIPLPLERDISSLATADHALRGYHVLLVEDEDIIRKVTVKKLLDAGAKVATASDGKEAVIICRSRKFDFVLMDLEMPNLSGLDACREIRQIGLNENTPIFGLSSHLRKHRWESAAEAGMNDLFTKPIEIPVICAVYESMARRKPDNLRPPKAVSSTSILDLSVFREACDCFDGRCNMDLLNGFIGQALAFKGKLEATEVRDRPKLVHGFKGVSMIFGATLLTEKLFVLEGELRDKALDEDQSVATTKEVVGCIDETIKEMLRLAQGAA